MPLMHLKIIHNAGTVIMGKRCSRSGEDSLAGNILSILPIMFVFFYLILSIQLGIEAFANIIKIKTISYINLRRATVGLSKEGRGWYSFKK